jgi:hypothetical protein
VTEPTDDEIDGIATLIREIDGRHDMGAGALAESLVTRGVRLEARLRERIAGEIEAAEVAGLEPGPGGLGPAARWGLGLAARIARGA